MRNKLRELRHGMADLAGTDDFSDCVVAAVQMIVEQQVAAARLEEAKWWANPGAHSSTGSENCSECLRLAKLQAAVEGKK